MMVASAMKRFLVCSADGIFEEIEATSHEEASIKVWSSWDSIVDGEGDPPPEITRRYIQVVEINGPVLFFEAIEAMKKAGRCAL